MSQSTQMLWVRQAEHTAKVARYLANGEFWSDSTLWALEACELAIKAMALNPTFTMSSANPLATESVSSDANDREAAAVTDQNGCEAEGLGNVQEVIFLPGIALVPGETKHSHKLEQLLDHHHHFIPEAIKTALRALKPDKLRLRLRYPDPNRDPRPPFEQYAEHDARNVLAIMEPLVQYIGIALRGEEAELGQVITRDRLATAFDQHTNDSVDPDRRGPADQAGRRDRSFR